MKPLTMLAVEGQSCADTPPLPLHGTARNTATPFPANGPGAPSTLGVARPADTRLRISVTYAAEPASPAQYARLELALRQAAKSVLAHQQTAPAPGAVAQT